MAQRPGKWQRPPLALANRQELVYSFADKVMQQYRQQRLEQLKRETRLRQEQSASGLGKLCHVAEAEAMVRSRLLFPSHSDLAVILVLV